MPKNPKIARAKAKKAASAAQPAAGLGEWDDIKRIHHLPCAQPMQINDTEDMERPAVAPTPAVYRPGVHSLDEGEVLDYDRTAYDSLHKWTFDWPCLSFDFVRDSLGAPRSAFPHTAFLVAGTQAAARQPNQVVVAKLSEMTQGEHGKKAAGDSDDDMDDEDDDEDANAAADAKLHTRQVAFNSPVNRVRCMHQQPGIVALWAESGAVSVLNLTHLLTELAEEREPRPKSKNSILQVKAMHSHPHSSEGFALSWSRQTVGALASGDCRGKLHTWEPKEGGSWLVSASYKGHGGSVEDLEWSPTEATVLASACVDKMIRIYDTRDRGKPQLAVPAHAADVNVISWNTLTSYMLASGGDDGAMRIWDLRALPGHVANFTFHQKPVTSIEWCPHESSMLATCAEDDVLGVWDLALERDPDEEAHLAPVSSALEQQTPPQLLFMHAGQTHMKELHWHPQIPGMLASTAEDGFNMFKPANVAELTPQQAR